MSEANNIKLAKEGIRTAKIHLEALEQVLKMHEAGARNLEARLRDAEERAALYEKRADAYIEKAGRTDELETASKKLIEQLDALPLEMKDAGMIQKATPSEILLYDTYDWESVMFAKFELMAAMKKGEKDADV